MCSLSALASEIKAENQFFKIIFAGCSQSKTELNCLALSNSETCFQDNLGSPASSNSASSDWKERSNVRTGMDSITSCNSVSTDHKDSSKASSLSRQSTSSRSTTVSKDLLDITFLFPIGRFKRSNLKQENVFSVIERQNSVSSVSSSSMESDVTYGSNGDLLHLSSPEKSRSDGSSD